MKTSSPSVVLAFSVAIVGLFALPMNSGTAKPGGLYRGNATGNKLLPAGMPQVPFGTTPIKIRFPNGKGSLKGSLLTTQTKVPRAAPVNMKIFGKVRKSVSRQGGRKTILTGRWTWNFIPLGAPSKADGPFVIIIKKSGNRYKVDPPERVNVRGPAVGAGPAYSFKCTVRAKK